MAFYMDGGMKDVSIYPEYDEEGEVERYAVTIDAYGSNLTIKVKKLTDLAELGRQLKREIQMQDWAIDF